MQWLNLSRQNNQRSKLSGDSEKHGRYHHRPPGFRTWSDIRKMSNHSTSGRFTFVLPPSPSTYSSHPQHTLPEITTIICVLLASTQGVPWKWLGSPGSQPSGRTQTTSCLLALRKSPMMALSLQMNFELSLPSGATPKKSTVRHWALKYTVLPDHWEPKQARIFHGSVYSMPAEGKKGDLKKFGFVIGLRATDMLNNLLIWALDTEATEGFCFSDSVSIL